MHGDAPTIRDLSVEEEIRRHAPWEVEPHDPDLGSEIHWRLANGAMWFRGGHWTYSVASWLPLAGAGDAPRRLPEWTALALARAGRLPEALALLSGRPSHLRGEVLAASGDLAAGLAEIAAGLRGTGMTGPAETWRVLRLATWLAAAGRHGAAASLLETRLASPGLFERELRVAAVQRHRADGHPERALAHLEWLRRDAPGLTNQLQCADAATFEWMPEPVRRLGQDKRVWLLDEQQAASLQSDAGPFRAFAQCPVRVSRSVRRDAPGLLCFDSAQPTRIALCLHPDIPAFLWPRAPATAEGLERLLPPYERTLERDDPFMRDLPQEWVAWVELERTDPATGASGPTSLADFGRHAAASPHVEGVGWGTAFVEDPCRDVVDTGGGVARDAYSQQDSAREEGESFRTRYSRSVVSYRTGPFGDTLAIRYRPSPHPGAVAVINRERGTRFPEDLPLDAVGLLLSYDAVHDAAWWQEAGDDNGDAAIAELLHESPAFDAWLPTLDEGTSGALAFRFNRLSLALHGALESPDWSEILQSGPSVQQLRHADETEGDPWEQEENLG